MIICDRHRFVFLHIPKCAGTTVRKPLEPWDDTEGRFSGRVDNHPALGKIDYVHLPLFILREHFSAEYEKVRSYTSYTVIREPQARFPSSLSQYAKKYGHGPVEDLRPSELHAELDKVIRLLGENANKQALLPPELIHFQRQSDFVFDQQQCVVDRIFLPTEIDTLLTEIHRHHGLQRAPTASMLQNKNSSLAYRNPLWKPFLKPLRKHLWRHIGPHLTVEMRTQLKRLFFHRPQREELAVFRSTTVQDFLQWYYADDLRLYASVKEKENATAIAL